MSQNFQNIFKKIYKFSIFFVFHRIKEKNEPPSALNGFLYSLLRNTKPPRRALIQSILKQFDDQKISLHQMLYLADNLAFFPYLVQDEPLYLIHQIDLVVSVSGTNVLANFREGLKPNPAIQNRPEDRKSILISIQTVIHDLYCPNSTGSPSGRR